MAYGSLRRPGPVLVARDTRTSGPMFGFAVVSGLMSVGCRIIDLGIQPTPTLQLAIPHWEATGAVAITASHNPPEWNALKFFDPEGMYLDHNQLTDLRKAYERGSFYQVAWNEVPSVCSDDGAGIRHVEKIVRTIDVQRIKARKFRVVLDCGGGAGVKVTPLLLKELGCDVRLINDDPSAMLRRPPEPIPENLEDLSHAVREGDADLGMAHDSDADRLALVSNDGQPLSEEWTLVLCVYHVLAHRRRGPVVTNLSTTRAVNDIADMFAVPVYRTPVGDINVSKRLKELQGAIGGEGNGGIIFPPVQFARDAIAAAGLILELLAFVSMPLSALISRLPKYHIVKKRMHFPVRLFPSLVDRIKDRYVANEVIEEDGIKLLWSDCWVHIRPSGTEPILRIIAEAPFKEQACQLCDQMMAQICQWFPNGCAPY